MRYRATCLLVVVLTASLAACSALPQQDGPTQPSSSATSATPSPAPSTTPEVAAIDISPTQLVLDAPDGTAFATYEYTDAAAPLLEQLTTSFGSAPTATPYDGGLDGPSGTHYNWDGFTLEILDVAGATNQIRFRVIAQSASCAGVAVSALDFSVGSTIASLKAAGATLAATYDGANGPAHDGDMYRYGTTSSLGTTYSVAYFQKSLDVGEILAPTNDNGA